MIWRYVYSISATKLKQKTTSPTIPRTQTSAVQIATDIAAMIRVLAKFGPKSVKYFRFKRVAQTQAILFLKSMSERGRSDMQRH